MLAPSDGLLPIAISHGRGFQFVKVVDEGDEIFSTPGKMQLRNCSLAKYLIGELM